MNQITSTYLRGTLDGGLRERVLQNRAILLAARCKLDGKPLDKGPRPRRGKARCLLHGIILEENINGPN